MIRLHPSVHLDEAEIRYRFTRSGGPGGQHVNTTATAVEARLDVMGSASLSDAAKARLCTELASRMTTGGEVIVRAESARSQKANREEARERLVALLVGALREKRPRKKSRISLNQKRKRLDSKKKRSATKRLRGPVGGDD